MRDLLGADIEDHIAVFRGRSAVPALEEIGHHDTDLAPLAAEHLLQLLGIDRVGTLGLGVVLELVGAEEHCAAPLLWVWINCPCGRLTPTCPPVVRSGESANRRLARPRRQ